MRKALFALVLVAAAFAGGAAMNGPGLAWFKAKFVGALKARLIVADPPTKPNPPPMPTPSVSSLDFVVSPDKAGLPKPETPAPLNLPSSTIAVASPPPKSDALPILLADPDPARTLDAPVIAASGASTGPIGDWNELRRRLREAGVTRYELETELGGRARFRCLIPLAGRRAVGQQFEGEGDDDFRAAEAALRRIALWKATEREESQ